MIITDQYPIVLICNNVKSAACRLRLIPSFRRAGHKLQWKLVIIMYASQQHMSLTDSMVAWFHITQFYLCMCSSQNVPNHGNAKPNGTLFWYLEAMWQSTSLESNIFGLNPSILYILVIKQRITHLTSSIWQWHINEF